MARIAGIQIEKNIKDRSTVVRINLKKQPQTMEFLNNAGAVDNSMPNNGNCTPAVCRFRIIA